MGVLNLWLRAVIVIKHVTSKEQTQREMLVQIKRNNARPYKASLEDTAL